MRFAAPWLDCEPPMSIEVTVICDGCGEIMAGAKTAREARESARDGRLEARTYPGGRDYCGPCRAAGKHRSEGSP